MLENSSHDGASERPQLERSARRRAPAAASEPPCAGRVAELVASVELPEPNRCEVGPEIGTAIGSSQTAGGGLPCSTSARPEWC